MFVRGRGPGTVRVKNGVLELIELACCPLELFLTITGVTDEAPAGTFTSISVPAELALTVTFTGPKKISFGPDGLNIEPEIVTSVPAGA